MVSGFGNISFIRTEADLEGIGLAGGVGSGTGSGGGGIFGEEDFGDGALLSVQRRFVRSRDKLFPEAGLSLRAVVLLNFFPDPHAMLSRIMVGAVQSSARATLLFFARGDDLVFASARALNMPSLLANKK